MAHCPVIPFNIAILLRLPRLNVRQTNTLSSGPALQSDADIFRFVITVYLPGVASSFDYLLQRPYHTFSRKRKVNLNAKPFPVKNVDDVPQLYAAAVLQLVMHEIH